MSEFGLAERVGIEPTVPLPGQQFSRLPDSATLAPLRVVELASRLTEGRAYRAASNFSIGFVFSRRASTMGDPRGLMGSIGG